MRATRQPPETGDIDPAFLAAHGIVPVGVEDGRLVVRMADPDDAETLAALAFAARRPVTVERAGPVPPVPEPSPTLADRIAAGLGGNGYRDWAAADAAGAASQDVADRMRFDLECGIAVRRALAVPALALIVAAVTVGGWGLLLLPALWPLGDAIAALARVRRAGDGAEAADRARALLRIAHAEGRTAMLVLLGLAVLLVVRLG